MAKTKEKATTKTKEEEYRPKIRIKVKAYDHKIIDQALKTIIEAIGRTGAKIFGPIPLPTEKKVYTVNRSTFVHKDHRDQFESRIHKRLIDVIEIGPKTIETLTELHLPAGVDIEIKM
jgi:small subunit ribosomal protein S10